MDPQAIAEFAREYLLPHWAFFVAALVFGLVAEPMKRYVWSDHNARRSKFVWWMRAFLPFHPVVVGFVLGLVGWYVWKDAMVASPGVEGPAAIGLYYAGAGVVSSWLFASVKYVLRKRGLLPPTSAIEMPSYPPKPTSKKKE